MTAQRFVNPRHALEHANVWGGRVLLSTVIPKYRDVATLIDTPMCVESTMFRLSLNFGGNNATAPTPTPIGFTPLAAARVEVTIRHGMDDRQGTTDDVYHLSPTAELQAGETGVTNPVWMPVSYIQTRKLTVICKIVPAGGLTATSVWCDFACTPITSVDTEAVISARGNSNIFGWGSEFQQRIAQNAASVQLLDAETPRRRFIITNMSTASLALSFGTPASLVPGSENFAVMLAPMVSVPANRYESPIDGYWGNVNGIWTAAGAGYAMVSETDIFA